MSERQAKSCGVARSDGSKFIDSIVDAYDPDAGFSIKNVASHYRNFIETLITKNKEGKLPDLIESASIIEVNRFGAFRVRKLKSTEEFRAALAESNNKSALLTKIVEAGVKLRPAESFTETDRAGLMQVVRESEKFREDFDISSNTNTASTDPFNEYIPILGGPFSHQLYLHDFLDMLAKSFEAWNHNPLAHQIVKLTTHFVLGRGITLKARDALVQERFQDWWDKNDMVTRLEYWSDMLSRDGELMIRCFVNPLSQELFVRWVDPSTIWEIVTDLEDIERVFYYHQQYPTAYQVLYGAPNGAKYNPSDFESSKYVINQIPAEEIYHVKVNCSPNEKRGRSDLFSILGWLKRYKDFQTAVVLRAIVQSTFAWKNKLSGSDTDVQAFINAFGTDQPRFSEVWVENEASDLQPMTADLKSGNGLADCPGIVNAISVGSGIPKEYMGISDTGTRATAVVSSEPGVKKFQARQLLMGRLLRDIAQRWAEIEIKSGRIPAQQPANDSDLPAVLRWMKKVSKTMPFLSASVNNIIRIVSSGSVLEPTDCEIEFQFPEIATEDRAAKLKDIQGVQMSGYISKRRAATMSAKELGVEEYNYDDEMDEIADETASDLSTLYPALATAPAGAPGQPQPAKPGAPAASEPEPQPAPSGSLSAEDRRDIKRNDRR